MIKLKLIGFTEISSVAVLHMELKGGLLLSRGCVKGLLSPQKKLYLLGNLEEVINLGLCPSISSLFPF